MLLGKKRRKLADDYLTDFKLDLGNLKEKVFLKIMEDCDDPGIVSNETLTQACLLFDEFSYHNDQSHVVREVYNQVIRRCHLLSPLQLS